MIDPASGSVIPNEDFHLGPWQVRPSLNRLILGSTEVQVEPKQMDVLAVLAVHAGEVVSKERLTDTVWADVIITESVITRAVAGLRRALSDDARQPRFIETISKRGYRLVAPVSRDRGPDLATRTPASVMPYVVGQWVRGERFYGRRQLLSEILEGHRRTLWLMGTRRMGKTSLLKQAEFVASNEPQRRLVPIFWDLEGVDGPDDLHLDFKDALLDAEPALTAAGVRVSDLETDDLFTCLATLRRRLQASGLEILLLMDEGEALIHLGATAPTLLAKLRRALQSSDGIRAVIAASGRLWNLDSETQTSPFLDGFTPPLVLNSLSRKEAVELIQQHHLQPSQRPPMDDDLAQAIASESGNHPYLCQLVAKRVVELGDFERALHSLDGDRTLDHFFKVDLAVLDEEERSTVISLAANPSTTTPGPGCLERLIRLGMVNRQDGSLASPLFERWLNGQRLSA